MLNIVLVIIVIALVSYTVYLNLALSKMAGQLEMIITKETNKEVRVNSRNPYLVNLAKKMNGVIQKEKKTRHQSKETQRQFDQAIHNITHDVRTPLTVAHGYTQFLTEHRDLSREEQASFLKKIMTNLTVVAERIEVLLTYNRMIEKEMVATYEHLNISQLLETECLKYYDSFQEKSLELSLQIEPNVTLTTSKEHVQRIIQNMIGNMLEHANHKGSISLSLKENEVELIAENNMLGTISQPERLFERFYTEDLSRQKKNAGLGLFIIKELADEIGGKANLSVKENVFKLIVIFPIHESVQ